MRQGSELDRQTAILHTEIQVHVFYIAIQQEVGSEIEEVVENSGRSPSGGLESRLDVSNNSIPHNVLFCNFPTIECFIY